MLSQAQKRRFKGIAHHLKPVVIIAGNGLSDGVIHEIERALMDHELIKIRIAAADRSARRELITAACEATGAELVQTIGSVAVIYKPADQPDPALSNILRGNPP